MNEQPKDITDDMSLEAQAIDIQGKKYVLVADRIVYFNNTYPNGAIQTELLSQPSDEMVVVKATVYPNVESPDRAFTGFSQAKWGAGFINKTSALENAETSAVGRALSMMGIGVIDSIASVDEINKAQTYGKRVDTPQEVEDQLCEIHNVVMPKRLSTKTNKPYWAHKLQDGKLCFGRDK